MRSSFRETPLRYGAAQRGSRWFGSETSAMSLPTPTRTWKKGEGEEEEEEEVGEEEREFTCREQERWHSGRRGKQMTPSKAHAHATRMVTQRSPHAKNLHFHGWLLQLGGQQGPDPSPHRRLNPTEHGAQHGCFSGGGAGIAPREGGSLSHMERQEQGRAISPASPSLSGNPSFLVHGEVEVPP